MSKKTDFSKYLNIMIALQIKAVSSDGIIEVYFYSKIESGWKIFDNYHTVRESDIVTKINHPEYVKMSCTRCYYHFNDPRLDVSDLGMKNSQKWLTLVEITLFWVWGQKISTSVTWIHSFISSKSWKIVTFVSFHFWIWEQKIPTSVTCIVMEGFPFDLRWLRGWLVFYGYAHVFGFGKRKFPKVLHFAYTVKEGLGFGRTCFEQSV